MKTIKRIILIALLITILYLVLNAYTNKVDQINKGEITQISESYRDR